MSEQTGSTNGTVEHLRTHHLGFGWTMLLVFIMGGVSLEILHGFKIGWYLDVGNEVRRLMFRLAHAHGTLLAIVNIIFALSAVHFSDWSTKRAELASRSLKIASVLLPGGFFAGGFFIYDGDPGLGIFLVPLGALALVIAVGLTMIAARKAT